MKKLLFSLLFTVAQLLCNQSFAQKGVAINTTGADAASSAMLDVSSTTKGVLVPRMSLVQRTGILSPAKGLLVYQDDGTEGFYYYDGGAWTKLANGTYTETDPVVKAINGIVKSDGTTIAAAEAGTDYLSPATGWSMTGNTGTTPGTNFIGTKDEKALVFKVNNVKAGEVGSNYNTSFGIQTLGNNPTGNFNIAIGMQALYKNTSGSSNTATGASALSAITTGWYNTGNGTLALAGITTSWYNTAHGAVAGFYITGGSVKNTTGSNSVYLGGLTKAFADAQTNEIVIGYDATGAGSHSATLGNTSITTTVLRGNVRHYGTTSGYVGLQAPANVSTVYSLTLPDAAPVSNGQVLSANTAGVMSWAAPATGTVSSVTGTAPISVATGTSTPVISIAAATTSAAGSMSAADKTKLDGSIHAVGDHYGGGIVFYVYDGGRHGLIAAEADQSTYLGLIWYNGTSRSTGASGDGLLAGAMNTAMIVATQMADDQAGSFAAKLCADYSVTDGGVTYGDWYLPSKYELNLLYVNRNIVGNLASTWYWSSTEAVVSGYPGAYAWQHAFSTNLIGEGHKQNANYVRAIRSF